jgi:hypothetical protein
MEAGMELVVLALVGWLVWSRYLHHQEVKLLLEKGGDARVLLEVRQRWQVRWGIVIGVIVLVIGIAVAIAGLVIPMHNQERLASYVIGGCLASIGLVIAGAHLIWGRGGRASLYHRDAEAGR